MVELNNCSSIVQISLRPKGEESCAIMILILKCNRPGNELRMQDLMSWLVNRFCVHVGTVRRT
jgi:hypothetical protein